MTALDDAPGTPLADAPLVDAAQIRAAMDHYTRQGLSDGLPVVPVTEEYLQEFLAVTTRDPDEVLLTMAHLNRQLTVRLAAVNAALAGCRPDFFPVVLAAWDALATEPYPVRGIWQSTTGTAPFLIVNGPVRDRIGLNSRGNVFGSGFPANATIGRAIRLAAINVFGLQPHQLDQATQATPAKYTACIAANEEDSPWEPLHVERGLAAGDSTVTATVIRSVVHVEARHTHSPEQLARDVVDTITRTGALLHEYTSAFVVLGPEHARVFADAGWSKEDTRRFLLTHAVRPRAELAAVGKDAISRHTRWRLPADHPDAVPDQAGRGTDPDLVPVLGSPGSVQVVVAGADNAGVSAVVEVFGHPREWPASIARVEAPPIGG
ncbi:hypothetical protein [Geodermatophilus sabuli]|uniref:Uncharacterized protein n=1 Tax=Geodermatophilus sabuli TaxID=1564158 RepID=A0A285EFU2_9ACTN|nr:hypothetical protein [Geodermatophilus sabuli]MBB3082926.1 hypothetical protein [Geodermatophilus sabuli]SNX97925.1 hypothetical protein SAMN06893097_1095 [Geodermatophilus sabuli]